MKKEMTLFDKVEAAYYVIEPLNDRYTGEIEALQKDNEKIKTDIFEHLNGRTENELEDLEADYYYNLTSELQRNEFLITFYQLLADGLSYAVGAVISADSLTRGGVSNDKS